MKNLKFIKPFNHAKTLFLFSKFVKDPTKTEKIFEIIEWVNSLPESEETIQKMEQRFLEDSGFNEMWKTKWIPETPKLEQLSQMSKESLGYAYFLHLEKYNLDLQFFPKIKTERLIDYISYRVYHAHDLWHVLLNSDVTPKGELEVQSFSMAQFGSPISALLICGGLLNLLQNEPLSLKEVFEGMMIKYQVGQKSKFLLGCPIEDRLEENLSDLRDEFFAQIVSLER